MLRRIEKKILRPFLIQHMPSLYSVARVNLCSGGQVVDGYCAVDLTPDADVILDVSKGRLPFRDDSLDALVCMSAINYFTRSRGEEIVGEVFRVLKHGGIARFGVQDLETIARRYVEKDTGFFFQKLPDGRERFEGITLGDKFAAWFYGYATAGGNCKYFYDFESLAWIFRKYGFSIVERREFQSSRLPEVARFDNRPDQMFFLEAVK